jgi:hypothetical protein
MLIWRQSRYLQESIARLTERLLHEMQKTSEQLFAPFSASVVISGATVGQWLLKYSVWAASLSRRQREKPLESWKRERLWARN